MTVAEADAVTLPAPATPRRRPELLPVLFLWAVCLVDYGRVVLPGPWPRQYIAESDLSRQFFPFQHFVARQLAAGRLPAWNPYLYAGHPQLADPQTAVFSPLGLLINLSAGRVDLPYLAIEWRAVLDYMLAALFAYLFFQQVAQSTVGGTLGALCFTFGGFLSSYPLPQLPVLETALWLPLVLYCLERALSAQRGAGWAAAAGLAGGCLALAGHAQTAMLAAYAAAAYAAYRVAVLRPPAPAAAGRLLLAAGIAAGIAAAQLLPTLAFAGESTRAHLSSAEAGGGYSLTDFRELLLPGGIFQRSYFIGILPLALAAVAATRRGGRFWLALWLAAAVVALGAHTPLFQLLYDAGPGFAAFRDQERAAALANLATCALAAQGAGRLIQAAPRRPVSLPPLWLPAAVAAAIPSLVAVVLLWPAGSTPGGSVQAMPLRLNLLTAALLAVTAVVVVALAASRRLPVVPLAGLLLAISAANLLAAGANLSRADRPPAPPPAVAASLRWIAAQPGLARAGNSSDGVITNNLGTLFEVPVPAGDSPIETRRVADLVAATNGYRAWQLFNVRYVLTRRPPGAGFVLAHQEGDLDAFALQYGLPRAWAVRDVRLAASADQARQLTVALEQPGAAAVLEERPGLALAGPDRPRDQRETWLLDAPGDLRLAASTTDNAMLVLSVPYVRGWQATLDGRPTPLYHADLALMALDLPAGEHTVALCYVQPGLRAGLALAALALLAAALAAVAQRRPVDDGR